MQKFHIHTEGKDQGPFSITELKELRITRETKVWFEGAENWMDASEIEELKDIFKSIPPPFKKVEEIEITKVVEPNLVNGNKYENPKNQSKKGKSTLIIIAVALLLGIGGLVFLNQQSKQAEIERQLEDQRIKIQEQEKIEADRRAALEKKKREEEAAQRKAELESLKYELDQAVTNLRAARIRLNEIQQFQFLRTAQEKQQQVQEQLEVIRSWENEVDRLQNEVNNF